MYKIDRLVFHSRKKSKKLNKEDEVYLNLVTNYMPETIYSVIKKLNKKKERINP